MSSEQCRRPHLRIYGSEKEAVALARLAAAPERLSALLGVIRERHEHGAAEAIDPRPTLSMELPPAGTAVPLHADPAPEEEPLEIHKPS